MCPLRERGTSDPGTHAPASLKPCVLEGESCKQLGNTGGPSGPVLQARLVTGTSCLAPACKEPSGALPEIQDLGGWGVRPRSPRPRGRQGTLTVGGAPGPAQDPTQTRITAGLEPSYRGTRHSSGPRFSPGLGDSVIDNLHQADLGPQCSLLQTWASGPVQPGLERSQGLPRTLKRP